MTVPIYPDIWPGQNGSDPSGFAVYQGTLYFSANDGTLGGEPYELGARENGVFRLNPIPEPATLVLLGLAAVCLLPRLLRRSRGAGCLER